MTRSIRVARLALGLLLALVLTTGGLLAVTASPAAACSCVGGPARAAVRHSEAIFHGVLVEDRRAGNGGTVVFEVDRVWKGEVPGTVEVRTGLGGGDCGLEYSEGHEDLVFASRGPDDVLSTGICSSRGATLTDLERLVGEGAPPASDVPVAESVPLLALLLRVLRLAF